MNTLRTALVSALTLTLSAFALGGCAEAAGDDEELPAVDTVSASQPRTTTSRPAQVSVPTQIVFPQCRAVLISTGPIANAGANSWGCPAADPYTAQRRFSGEVEGGIIEHRDEAQFGKFVCSTAKNGLQPTCTKNPDRLLEKTCTELRVYECPCGVENVPIEGGLAGACRRAPL